MKEPEDTRLSQVFRHGSRGASAVSILVGILVLFGWMFDISSLKSVFSGFLTMKANTAVGFILAGVSLWNADAEGRVARIVSQCCGAGALLLGLLVTAEYVTGADLGIDQLLFLDITHVPGDIPGRMTINTAVCFSTLGAALVLLSRRNGGAARTIHVLASVPLLVAGTALVGYGYGIETFLLAKLRYSPMALHAAAIFVTLGLGVISARPEYPFRRILASNSEAGSMERRLLPTAVALQLVVGWLLLQGLNTGYLSATAGLALFVMVNIGGLGALIQWSAIRLYQSEAERRAAEEALRKSTDEVEDLYHRAPVAYHSLDKDGTIVRINDTELAWLGYAREEIVGRMKYPELLTPESLKLFQANFVGYKTRGWIRDLEFDVLRKDGTTLPVLLSATAITDPQGHFVMSRSTMYDLTERKQAEAVLRESEERYRSVVAALFEGGIYMDAEGVVRAANPSAERILGVTLKQIIGRTPLDPDWHPVREDGSPFPIGTRPAWTTLQSGRPCRNVTMGVRKPNGGLTWVMVNSEPLNRPGDARPYAVVVSFVDITERKQAEEKLRALQARLHDQSIRDPLTGLYNRRYLNDTLRRELDRAERDRRPLSILMADIDFFKRLNDTHGHQAHHSRSSDIPCRYGGEEFLVVLPDMPPEVARERAEQVRRDFADQRVAFGGSELTATLSIGVSGFPSQGKTADDLIGAADSALYQAKQSGRNRVHYADRTPHPPGPVH